MHAPGPDDDLHHADEHDSTEHASVDEIDFVPPPEVYARTRRHESLRRMEPTVLRSIGLAVMVGAILGAMVFYFKPMPRGARAEPVAAPGSTGLTAPAQKRPVELFELLEWDEQAHQRYLQQAR